MLRIVVLFMTLALSIASAKTYKVNIFMPMNLAGTELKVGAFSLDLNGDTMVVRQGKTTVEAKVKVATSEDRHSVTKILCSDENGKYTIKTIYLGGTNMDLVID